MAGLCSTTSTGLADGAPTALYDMCSAPVTAVAHMPHMATTGL